MELYTQLLNMTDGLRIGTELLEDATVFKIDAKKVDLINLVKKDIVPNDHDVRLPYDNIFIEFNDELVWAIELINTDPEPEPIAIGCIPFKKADLGDMTITGKNLTAKALTRFIENKMEKGNQLMWWGNTPQEIRDQGMFQPRSGFGSIPAGTTELDLDLQLTHEDLSGLTRSKQALVYLATVYPVLAFLKILGCKNVQTTKQTSNISKLKRRKYKKSKIWKEAEYHVLELKPSKGIRGSSGHTRADSKMHFCRGHFKTYTAAKPHVSGIVGDIWCPAHLKGDPEIGTVVKDYNATKLVN